MTTVLNETTASDRVSRLVRNLFYNDIFFDVLFKRLEGDKRLSHCLLNTSTFVPFVAVQPLKKDVKKNVVIEQVPN